MINIADVFNQAVHSHQAGDLARAETLCRTVLQADTSHAPTHHLLGLLAHQAGNSAAAIAFVRQAIELAPADPGFRFNLGIILTSQGLSDEAIDCYREAIRLNPQHVQAYNNLGNTLLRQAKAAEAAASYRQALALNPRHPSAQANLDLCLAAQANEQYTKSIELTRAGEFQEALDCGERACAIAPRNELVLCQRALVRVLMGDIEGGKCDYESVLRLNPANQAVLWSRGLLRLLDGDFERGWQDYEYRWTQPDFVRRYADMPRWDGSSFVGKTIFVHAEQGLGDTLQFIRYLPLVKQRGGTVLFGCQPALMGLCATAAGIDQLVSPGSAVPSFDFEAPLLSLPGIFKTSLANIPSPVPYLRADAARVANWRRELAPLPGLKVGIVWEGSPRNKGNRLRSLPLAHFERLACRKPVRLISMQVGPGTAQLPTAPFPILDLGSRFERTSLDDLAAALTNLDLFITVETAPAHLAGALGVPTWTLLPFSADWRWLRDRDDSPWYPTMRLFRQPRFGDWTGVMDCVEAELRRKIGE